MWEQSFCKESRDLAKKPVSEVMTPAKFFVEPTDPLTKAAYMMIHHDLILLACVGEQEEVCRTRKDD